MRAAGRLFCFGLGYCALALARELRAQSWRVSGTCRGEAKRRELSRQGIGALVFDGKVGDPAIGEALRRSTHLLSSVPPEDADPVLEAYAVDIAHSESIEWIGYLSTTGVYGDRAGGLVDEDAELRPTGERGRQRVAAERMWRNFWDGHGLPVHLFRLAGIYGPGRSVLDRVRSGTARRVDRPGQVFSRIHVDDVVQTLAASIARPNGGRAYNVCDDAPAAPSDVVAYACELLRVPPPPLIPFDQAELSPMARSFYDDNKRVSNARIKQELGVVLRYPSYREGLEAILAAESSVPASAKVSPEANHRRQLP
jgi:nucleoside-diphosphate-sugar epimerase